MVLESLFVLQKLASVILVNLAEFFTRFNSFTARNFASRKIASICYSFVGNCKLKN